MSEKIRAEDRGGRHAPAKHLTVEQYEQTIEQTRHEIDRTLQSLEEKISPRHMWDRYSHEWGDELWQYSGNLGRSLKNNPVPATLLGISLLWLMAAESNGARHRPAVQGGSSGAGLREKYSKGKARAEAAIAGTGERMHSISDAVRDRQEHLRSKGREWSDRIQDRSSDLIDQPMLLASAGLLMGSLLALAMPTSKREREVIGEKGREMVEMTSEAARETMKQGQEAAAAAVETFQEELERKETGQETPTPEAARTKPE